jgi:hypothetical protein
MALSRFRRAAIAGLVRCRGAYFRVAIDNHRLRQQLEQPHRVSHITSRTPMIDLSNPRPPAGPVAYFVSADVESYGCVRPIEDIRGFSRNLTRDQLSYIVVRGGTHETQRP